MYLTGNANNQEVSCCLGKSTFDNQKYSIFLDRTLNRAVSHRIRKVELDFRNNIPALSDRRIPVNMGISYNKDSFILGYIAVSIGGGAWKLNPVIDCYAVNPKTQSMSDNANLMNIQACINGGL